MAPMEEWQQRLSRLLPQPVRVVAAGDGVLLVGGDPGEVMVRLDGAGVAVHVYGADGEGRPQASGEPMARVLWSQLPRRGGLAEAVLRSLIAAGVGIRRSTYQRCRSCSYLTPPELWMDDLTMCRLCARHEFPNLFHRPPQTAGQAPAQAISTARVR